MNGIKRILFRFMILINPIHPLKLSNKKREILFKVFRKTKWFKIYWRHYLNYFCGSQYPVFITHRDGKKEIGYLLYYPANGHDYSKANVEIYKTQSRKYISNTGVNYLEIPIKYINIVKTKTQ